MRRNGYLRITRIASAWALMLLSAAPALRAQQAAPATQLSWDTAIRAARATARQIRDTSAIPGLSLAVGVGGHVAYSEGFGYADAESRTPVSPVTRMRIGSVSKSVTSLAIGLLVESGQLDLDADVQTYVPTFPRKRWPITVRQIAGHTSGIRHYKGDENLSTKRYPTVLSGLEMFQDDTLLFQPGTRYSYSSHAWNLLSAVVEGASGQQFLPFMKQRVFLPLGLRSIVAEHTDSLIQYRSRFYQRTASGHVNAPYVDNSYKWAGGGFLSNTEDLVRLGYALLHNDLLKKETADLLFTSQTLTDGSLTNYGIGWSSGTDGSGRRMLWHTGGSVGGRAVLLLYPDHDIVVAMLANSGDAPMSVANARRIAEPFF